MVVEFILTHGIILRNMLITCEFEVYAESQYANITNAFFIFDEQRVVGYRNLD